MTERRENILENLKKRERPQMPAHYYDELASSVHERIDYGASSSDGDVSAPFWLRWIWTPALAVLLVVALWPKGVDEVEVRQLAVNDTYALSKSDQQVLEMVEEEELVDFLASIDPVEEGLSDGEGAEYDYLLEGDEFYFAIDDETTERSDDEVIEYLAEELDVYEIYTVL